MITDWLRGDPARTLMLSSRKMDVHQGRKGQEFNRPKVLARFFAHVDIPDDERERIDGQICVQGTKKLFQFQQVK